MQGFSINRYPNEDSKKEREKERNTINMVGSLS